MELKGLVESITKTETREGKPMWILYVDGKRFSIFDNNPEVQTGDMVWIDYYMKGSWTNIKRIEKLPKEKDSGEQQTLKDEKINSDEEVSAKYETELQNHDTIVSLLKEIRDTLQSWGGQKK